MNRQNFDTTSVTNYPLTIDRMSEMQGDLQAPMEILAGMLPEGNCILAGCASKGAAGWVRMLNEENQYEVFEVRAGSSGASYLALTTPPPVTAENSDGETVTVRVERYLVWSYNSTANSVEWADLPRMRVRLAAQDDAEWLEASGGIRWFAGTGYRLRVQRTGGRVHMWGDMTFGAYVGGSWITDGERVVVSGTDVRLSLESATILNVPEGYRPDGDMLIPIRYNGVASSAVLTSEGNLLLGRDSELGDTLKIDTYIEI